MPLLSQKLSQIFREPLVHFFVAAMLFFVVYQQLNPEEPLLDNTITISDARIEQLKTNFEKTWKRTANLEEIQKMINEYALNEMYARQAVELGLDQNDHVIRQRLRQKMDYFLDDMATATQPNTSELKAYYLKNSDLFKTEAKLSFQQIFFAKDQDEMIYDRKIKQAKSDIAANNEITADTSLLTRHQPLNTYQQIDRLFGHGFAMQLAKQKTGKWVGPIESSVGMHLININESIEGELLPLEKVKTKVVNHWQKDNAVAVKAAYQQELLAKYAVVINDGKRAND